MCKNSNVSSVGLQVKYKPIFWSNAHIFVTMTTQVSYVLYCTVLITRRHAIAKMTARCAQYMRGFESPENCMQAQNQPTIAQESESPHFYNLVTIRRWNYLRSIPTNVITAPNSDLNITTDRQTDTVASPRGKNRETNYRRYYRYHRYFKSKYRYIPRSHGRNF